MFLKCSVRELSWRQSGLCGKLSYYRSSHIFIPSAHGECPPRRCTPLPHVVAAPAPPHRPSHPSAAVARPPPSPSTVIRFHGAPRVSTRCWLVASRPVMWHPESAIGPTTLPRRFRPGRGMCVTNRRLRVPHDGSWRVANDSLVETRGAPWKRMTVAPRPHCSYRTPTALPTPSRRPHKNAYFLNYILLIDAS